MNEQAVVLRHANAAAGYQRLLWALAIIAILALVAAGAELKAQRGKSLDWFPLSIQLLTFIAFALYAVTAKLRIGASRLTQSNALPFPLLNWSMQWDDIERVEWRTAHNTPQFQMGKARHLVPAMVVVTSKSGVARSLNLIDWRPSGDTRKWNALHRKILSAVSPFKQIRIMGSPKPSDAEILEMIKAYPLSQVLLQQGIFPEGFVPPVLAPAAGTDIFRNPIVKWVLIALFCAAAYAFVELTIGEYWYANGTPKLESWIAGGFAASIALYLLRKGNAGWGETLLLSALWIFAGAGTAYFLALRVNGLPLLSDSVHATFAIKDGQLVPTSQQALPLVDLGGAQSCLRAAHADETLPLVLSKGLLGFWQLDYHQSREQLIDLCEREKALPKKD
jgi:hypothetical protein